MASAENVTDTKEFFARFNGGRKYCEKTTDGKSVELTVLSPSVENVELASEIIGSLDYPRLGVSENDARKKLVRLACTSCIEGVTDENVMAFLDEIDESSPVIRRCLKLLGIDDHDMGRIGIEEMPF